MGNIIDSVIGLSQWPAIAYVAWRAGTIDNPMPESTLSPQSGTMNLTPAVSRGENSKKGVHSQGFLSGYSYKKTIERVLGLCAAYLWRRMSQALPPPSNTEN
jgi:hypothetical protein